MKPSPPVRAAAWMTGAMVSFSLMAVSGRELAGDLDVFEIMFFRSLICIAIVVAAAAFAGSLGRISVRRFGLHALRNGFHFVGQVLWLYAITLVPLSQVFAFEFTTPLWVALLAPLFLAERMTVGRFVAASLGFAGILLVARPSTASMDPALFAAVFCALGFAGAVICTKLLARSESITGILFWMVVMQAVFGLAMAGIDLEVRVPRPQDLIWVMLIGVCGLMAHLCFTKALTLAPATVVGPLDFFRLPLIAVIGYFLYAEPLEVMVFLGAALVFMGNFLNIRAEHRAVSSAS